MPGKSGRHILVALLLLLIAIVGFAGERWQATLWETLGPKSLLVIYFATEDAQKLVGEQRWVAPGEATPHHAVEHLLRGSGYSDLIATVPAQARLLELTIRDGQAWVNFSRELVSYHPGGSTGEILTVYAIVNTLTEFPSIQRVLLAVEGEVQETLVGHLDVSGPLFRDEQLIAGIRRR